MGLLNNADGGNDQAPLHGWQHPGTIIGRKSDKKKPGTGNFFLSGFGPTHALKKPYNPGYQSVGRTSRSGPECGFQNKDLNVGDKAVIQTPTYPANYPPDIQCIWWL